MQRVRILYNTDKWAYHNKALALEKYAPADFDVSIGRYGRRDDLELALGDSPLDLVFSQPWLSLGTVRETLERRHHQ